MPRPWRAVHPPPSRRMNVKTGGGREPCCVRAGSPAGRAEPPAGGLPRPARPPAPGSQGSALLSRGRVLSTGGSPVHPQGGEGCRVIWPIGLLATQAFPVPWPPRPSVDIEHHWALATGEAPASSAEGSGSQAARREDTRLTGPPGLENPRLHVSGSCWGRRMHRIQGHRLVSCGERWFP